MLELIKTEKHNKKTKIIKRFTNTLLTFFDYEAVATNGEISHICYQICRGSVSGHGVEIFLQAEQKILSLVVDSLNAAIYWTTETSVEGCRLNGDDYQLLEKLSVFSGKEVRT